MPFHLVCVQPFHNYKKSDVITDPAEIARLSNDREHHFVRISDAVFSPPALEPTLAPSAPVDPNVVMTQAPPSSAKPARPLS